MNKDRRRRLQCVADTLNDAMAELMEIKDEEQDAFDNLPDSLQDSVRGEAMQEAIDTMDEWYNDIDTVRDEIEEYSNQ